MAEDLSIVIGDTLKYFSICLYKDINKKMIPELKKFYRNRTIIKYKRSIKYWANNYDIPPELIAGVIYNEMPKISDEFEKELDKNLDAFYNVKNNLIDTMKSFIEEDTLKKLYLEKSYNTIGPAQASENSSRKELMNLLPEEEQYYVNNLTKEQLRILLYDTNVAIRYIALVLAKVKKQKYPNKKASDLSDKDMFEIIKQWNSKKSAPFLESYPQSFLTMLPTIRYFLKEGF